jgi:hypothetical protein
VHATADALAPLFGVNKDDEDAMLGLRLLANGLVNMELMARAWGKKDDPKPAATAEDADV